MRPRLKSQNFVTFLMVEFNFFTQFSYTLVEFVCLTKYNRTVQWCIQPTCFQWLLLRGVHWPYRLVQVRQKIQTWTCSWRLFELAAHNPPPPPPLSLSLSFSFILLFGLRPFFLETKSKIILQVLLTFHTNAEFSNAPHVMLRVRWQTLMIDVATVNVNLPSKESVFQSRIALPIKKKKVQISGKTIENRKLHVHRLWGYTPDGMLEQCGETLVVEQCRESLVVEQCRESLVERKVF